VLEESYHRTSKMVPSAHTLPSVPHHPSIIPSAKCLHLQL